MSIIFKLIGGVIKATTLIFIIGILVGSYFLNKINAFQKNNDLHSEKVQLTNQVKELSASLDTIESISLVLRKSRDGYRNKLLEAQKQNEAYLQDLKYQKQQIAAQEQRILSLTERQHQLEKTNYVNAQKIDSLNHEKQFLIVGNRKLKTKNDGLWQNSQLLKEELNRMKKSEQSLLAQNILLLNDNQNYKERLQKLEYMEAWGVFLRKAIVPICLAFLCLVLVFALWRKSIQMFFISLRDFFVNQYTKLKSLKGKPNSEFRVQSSSNIRQIKRA